VGSFFVHPSRAMASGGEPLRDDAEAQVAEAQEAEGNTPVDLEKMWLEYKDNHNFFHQIELARDGGMSEASELIGTQRYIFGALPIIFVLMNVYSILTVNLTYLIEVAQPPSVNETNATDATDVFLVTRHFILDPLGVNIPSGGAGVIGIVEMFAVLAYVLRCFYWLFRIACPPEEEYAKWQAVQEFFWNALPEASTISAVKLLNYVTPQVLLPALVDQLKADGCLMILAGLAWFIVTRVVAALIGFDSLLFKLQVISAQIQTEISGGDPAVFTLLITCLTFLSQILGIVQVGWFVRKRIFAFIFAGEDGALSKEEEALKETWESMLAQRIWRELSWHQALAAYLSYSDYDFQKLALETVKPGHAEAKAAKKGGSAAQVELAAAS